MAPPYNSISSSSNSISPGSFSIFCRFADSFVIFSSVYSTNCESPNLDPIKRCPGAHTVRQYAIDVSQTLLNSIDLTVAPPDDVTSLSKYSTPSRPPTAIRPSSMYTEREFRESIITRVEDDTARRDRLIQIDDCVGTEDESTAQRFWNGKERGTVHWEIRCLPDDCELTIDNVHGDTHYAHCVVSDAGSGIIAF
ncbi:hypothetical protein GCK72_016074 [Caenorhabditis remanei]|uniref:Uncharacterized protein n=1 Tax=Caenorhabditis remanei TaxID=31234 RepID=A0A6A5GWQ2_CAERE|nr:hypothetical protein GCK72_016074 [Caenorhabditis remanei]KAF1759607.1 hypothetical protein GCK72_016074 [Caenorhabditis remanei]